MKNKKLKAFYKKMARIEKIKKCRGCICFVEAAKTLLDELGDKENSGMRKEIEKWVMKETHPCLGCDPCFPAEPYEEYFG